MNRFIIGLLLLVASEGVSAQYAYFATRGKIAFDRITFTRARMRDMQRNFDQMNVGGMRGREGVRIIGGMGFNIDNVPESSTEKYILEFDESATLMYVDTENEEAAESPASTGRMGMGARVGGGAGRAGQNMRSNQRSTARSARRMAGQSTNASKFLYQNYKDNTTELQVEIDDKYCISDTLNDIVWKFTDEYRNIAGYECRRVNGATKDSLYLVAFYTEEIPLSAGPALTNGLPGMILGLAIPELHIQYWATQVEYTNDLVRKDWRDKKAKEIDFTDFVNSFGRYFQFGGDQNRGRRQVEEAILY